MSDLQLSAAPTPVQNGLVTMAAASMEPCEECLGSGGWYRYEPSMEPAMGMLYLSCVQCRGSGRPLLARG